ncbi:MAG TPA: MFS transporter [Myxococcota bacterium]|jgi:MFS family permease|nr:MFS transporter [Myxococcota bacterium]
MADRRLLYVAAFLRALAVGMIGVLLGIYLPKLGLDPARAGAVIAAGLAGGAVSTLLATFGGDRFGRKRFLLALALVGAAGGAVVAVASDAVVLGAAAFAGMVNGMGRDRGASLVFDQAILPATAGDADRTRVFAWYNVLQDAGHALGGLCAGLPAVLRALFHVGEMPSLRAAVTFYAALLLLTAALYARLGPAIEAPPAAVTARRVPLSPETRRTLFKICALFSLDSLGGGFLTTALLSFFFYERFGAGEGVIGPLFAAARVMNAVSHLGAAWLARRIGLVNTMVFTHIPSSLLLVTVAFAPTFLVAAVLFVLREGLVEMDVPTRQSYVMAVVRPEERTFASGVTALVRLFAWAVAASFAGPLMSGVALMRPLLIGAGMKVVYDVLLWKAFRRLRPPEEGSGGNGPAAA